MNFPKKDIYQKIALITPLLEGAKTILASDEELSQEDLKQIYRSLFLCDKYLAKIGLYITEYNVSKTNEVLHPHFQIPGMEQNLKSGPHGPIIIRNSDKFHERG